LEREYEETRTKIVAAEARLGAMDKREPERRQTIAAKEELVDQARALKEAINNENKRWTFAGLGTPLHQVLLARIQDETLVDELESAALEILAERERVSAERRAEKAAKAASPTPATTKPPIVDTKDPREDRVRGTHGATGRLLRMSSPKRTLKGTEAQRAAIERLRERKSQQT